MAPSSLRLPAWLGRVLDGAAAAWALRPRVARSGRGVVLGVGRVVVVVGRGWVLAGRMSE